MAKLKRIVNLAQHDTKAADQEIAYWFVQGIDSMRYKMLPTAPQVFVNYKKANDEERKQAGKEFWNRDDVKTYLDTRMMIKNQNQSNLEWLQWAKKNIPEGDQISHEKLDNVITELRLRIKTE